MARKTDATPKATARNRRRTSRTAAKAEPASPKQKSRTVAKAEPASPKQKSRTVAKAEPASPKQKSRTVAKAGLTVLEVERLDDLRRELERASGGSPLRWNADPDDVQRSVAQLVLTLVEFIRQLLERQAIRRMEAG